MPGTSPATLRGLATAVPPYRIDQSDVTAIAERLFAPEFPDFDRMRPVFANSGIKQRHIARPVEWYLEKRGWDERTAVYLSVAQSLFCDAASKALANAELDVEAIDAVVTVSSTGIATPSLEARALCQMGFRSDILRVPVFGLGCAGGAAGLSIAERLASASPQTNILVVAVELCSLSFRLDKPTKANIVATALFADGAAAAVVSSDRTPGSTVLGQGRQHTWPQTTEIMGWHVDPNGFEVIFDRAIPPFARRHLGEATAAFLRSWDLSEDRITRFSFHPGGTKVLQAVERALELPDGALDIERDILAEFGNMSAPTALFVLEKELASRGRGPSVLTALGPGFTASAIPVWY